MRIIRDLEHCPADCQSAVMALGNFDGVHLGHRAILQHCIDLARADGKRPAVMTFEPHPREFFARDKAPLRIYPLRRKLELLKESGIDIVFLARFNQKLASTTAQGFIDLLHRQLRVHHIVTGFNFAFGKGREGSTAMLAKAAEIHEFAFSAYPPVHDPSGRVISSSVVRRALAEGNMEAAITLLGAPYQIEGRVMEGNRRGRELRFPTANIRLDGLFKPRFGVYAVRFAIAGELGWHDGVANLGIRPTFGMDEPLLEVHGFDMDRHLYGKRLCVRFSAFLREEKAFTSPEALTAQIAEDCRSARTLLKGAGE